MTPEQAKEQDVDPQSPTYGHAALVGRRVRLKDGREGEIDRVAMSDGTLYVWFGATAIPAHAEGVPADPMRIGVEEVHPSDATLI